MTPIAKIAIAISILIKFEIAIAISVAISKKIADRDQSTYFFISFIGKLVHNHLQKCLFNQKLFFSKFSFCKLWHFWNIWPAKRLIAEKKLKRSRSRFCDRDHWILRSRSSSDLLTKWRSPIAIAKKDRDRRSNDRRSVMPWRTHTFYLLSLWFKSGKAFEIVPRFGTHIFGKYHPWGVQNHL